MATGHPKRSASRSALSGAGKLSAVAMTTRTPQLRRRSRNGVAARERRSRATL
jgi:hypothetical protein